MVILSFAHPEPYLFNSVQPSPVVPRYAVAFQSTRGAICNAASTAITTRDSSMASVKSPMLTTTVAQSVAKSGRLPKTGTNPTRPSKARPIS
jgi:hypothetical protein